MLEVANEIDLVVCTISNLLLDLRKFNKVNLVNAIETKIFCKTYKKRCFYKIFSRCRNEKFKVSGLCYKLFLITKITYKFVIN